MSIQIDSVDAYQGHEKDIIIFNCVRSNAFVEKEHSLGFLLDVRRMNVAITRPRHWLYIIGNADTLERSEVWKELIDWYRES
jgi:superfamily I DNA and/or RNA helicase